MICIEQHICTELIRELIIQKKYLTILLRRKYRHIKGWKIFKRKMIYGHLSQKVHSEAYSKKKEPSFVQQLDTTNVKVNIKLSQKSKIIRHKIEFYFCKMHTIKIIIIVLMNKKLCSSKILLHLACDLEVMAMKTKDSCSGIKGDAKLRFLVGDIFELLIQS